MLVIVLILALAGAAYAIFSNWSGTADELVVVPGVLNLSEDAAKQKPSRPPGSSSLTRDQASATIEAGEVSVRTPRRATSCAKGETVSVYVSSGRGKVQVPNVVGKDRRARRPTSWASSVWG